MSDLVPLTPSPLVGRQLRHSVRSTKGEVADRAVRIQAQSYVANLAMQAVSVTAALEEELIRRAPLAENRLKLVADTHAGVVCAEVMRPW